MKFKTQVFCEDLYTINVVFFGVFLTVKQNKRLLSEYFIQRFAVFVFPLYPTVGRSAEHEIARAARRLKFKIDFEYIHAVAQFNVAF